MKKLNKTPLTMAIGSAMLVSGAAFADGASNPFAVNELSAGYQLAAADQFNNKVSEGGCASNTGSAVKKPESGAAKKTDGSCGEGMCGAMMKDGKMKPGMESSCGAMMKGKQGACGMMGGDSMKGMDHGAGAKSGGMDHGDKSSSKSSTEMSCGAAMHGGKEGACGASKK